MRVTLYGEMRSGKIASGPFALDDEGFWILASIVFLTTILMPLIKIIGTGIVLTGVITQKTPHWLARLFAFIQHINPWVMIEVYMLGFVVAYSRLQVMTQVHLAVAVAGLAGLMLSIAAMDVTIDPEAVWERIRPRQTVDTHAQRHSLLGCDTCFQVDHAAPEDPCSRCGDILHKRKPNSLARSWAFTIAATILYAPSNIFPIMHVTKLSHTESYTIFGGLKELAKVGLWPLAILVFCASIAIPVFKLIALTLMLIQTQSLTSKHLHQRTSLYRVIDFIGRWSMVDVFVVSILVALVRFGWLTQVTADWGVIYFAAVVVLTMLAVKSFDPRLMWDAAKAKQSSHSPHPPLPAAGLLHE